MKTRRNFLKTTGLAAASFGLGLPTLAFADSFPSPLFQISLAEWSLQRLLFAKQLDHLDFAIEAKKHKIEAVEYVNQFFMNKAKDLNYLREMKTRATGEGVTSVLIMCDREGMLGASTVMERAQTIENHKKWVEAAKFLGCHSIRVNAYTSIPFTKDEKLAHEALNYAAAGLHELCEFAADFDIHVLIENHGGFSSDGKWLAEMIRQADHKLAGTLPDFGNFSIHRTAEEIYSYDSYRGIDELMPAAKGVSLKPIVWDDYGKEHPLDYDRMMKIVFSHGFNGYVGIEHGEKDREWESIVEIREKLEAIQQQVRSNP